MIPKKRKSDCKTHGAKIEEIKLVHTPGYISDCRDFGYSRETGSEIHQTNAFINLQNIDILTILQIISWRKVGLKIYVTKTK